MVFAGGDAVGDDAGAGLDVGRFILDDQRTQSDAGVHIASIVDVADGAGVRAAAVRLQLVDDLHGADFGRAADGARREARLEGVERVLGLTQSAPGDFAFENVQAVYTLMRMLTLGGYVAAMGLSFAVFRRTSGVPAALTAVVFTATLPIHVHYSHFVRTESLGLVLCLVAVLIVLAPRAQGSWRTWLVAGALAGASGPGTCRATLDCRGRKQPLAHRRNCG